METKITCPVCKSKNCFESIDNNITSYLCLRCGYTSNSLYTSESKERNKHLANTAEIIKE